VTFRILPPIETGLPFDEAHKQMQHMIEEESLKLL
jgi:hypothetical protein